MDSVREKIKSCINAIEPFDKIEKDVINNVIEWIDSGVEMFRIEKPATPPKHLVCYTVIFDEKERKLLLFEHRKSQRTIPSGGHVDVNEMPYDTVKREMIEELDLELPLYDFNVTSPFFMTLCETVASTAGHIDVDMWYLFKGDSSIKINEEAEDFQREFAGYKWYTLDEVLALPANIKDENMDRFVMKIKKKFNLD